MFILSGDPIIFSGEELSVIYSVLLNYSSDITDLLKDLEDDDSGDYPSIYKYLNDIRDVMKKISDNGEFYPF